MLLLLLPSLVGRRVELKDTPHLLLVLHHLDVLQTTHHRRLGRRVVHLLGSGLYVQQAVGLSSGIKGVGSWGRGGGLQLGLMLWDLREILLRLPRVAEADGLDEVRVLHGAVRAGHHVAVVAVEVEALHRVQQHLEARIALCREERKRRLHETVA